MADPTYEDLIAASKNADSQGDSAGAKALLDAAAELYRANPGAVKKPGPFGGAISGMGTRYKDVPKGDDFMTPIFDALTMGQRGFTLGQSGNLAGLGSAVLTPLTGGSVLENFSAGKQQQMEAEQQAAERMTAGGVPLGMLPEAAGAIMTGAPAYKALGEAYPAVNSWLGTLLTGGAEGGVYAQGQDQDVLSGMLTGAGGAAAGRAVASTLGSVLDRLPSLNAQTRAAQSVVKQGRRSGVAPEDFIPELQGQITRLGSDAALADIDFMRPAVMGAMGPRSSIEAVADVYGLATAPNRNVQDIAHEEWSNIFAPARTAGQLKTAKKMTLDEAKIIYNKGLDNSKVRFRAQPFERMVEQAFGPRPTGNKKIARDAVMSYIADKTPIGADGKTRLSMTPRDLHEVKDAVDNRIKEIARTSADSKTNKALFDLSAKLNATIKDYVPEVRDAADIYSGQYAFDAAYETGYDLGKKGLKGQSLADLQEAIQAFSPQQKAAFSEGWRKSKVESGDISGIERQIKRVGPTKSNAELEIIDTLFGPGTGQKVVDASNKITAIEKTNKQASDKWRQVSEGAMSPIGGQLENVRGAADKATMVSQVIMNKLLGGAFQGAFGRQARRSGAQNITNANDQILDWATRTGNTPQTADDAIREIEQYLLRAQPAPLPAELGAQAGRVGAAFERSGRY